MPGTRRATGHRSRRRKPKSSPGRYAFAAVTTGVLGIGAISGSVALFRDGGEKPASAKKAAATSTGVGAVATPETGPVITLSTPDGYRYQIAAATAARKATGEAFIDYTLTNIGTARAPLEFPGDLFITRARAGAATGRCDVQIGIPTVFCGAQSITEIIGYLGTSPAPEVDDEDQWMPPGTGYLVRVSSAAKVDEIEPSSDLRLYVVAIRFTPDRKVIPIPFPKSVSG